MRSTVGGVESRREVAGPRGSHRREASGGSPRPRAGAATARVRWGGVARVADGTEPSVGFPDATDPEHGRCVHARCDGCRWVRDRGHRARADVARRGPAGLRRIRSRCGASPRAAGRRRSWPRTRRPTSSTLATQQRDATQAGDRRNTTAGSKSSVSQRDDLGAQRDALRAVDARPRAVALYRNGGDGTGIAAIDDAAVGAGSGAAHGARATRRPRATTRAASKLEETRHRAREGASHAERRGSRRCADQREARRPRRAAGAAARHAVDQLVARRPTPRWSRPASSVRCTRPANPSSVRPRSPPSSWPPGCARRASTLASMPISPSSHRSSSTRAATRACAATFAFAQSVDRDRRLRVGARQQLLGHRLV